MSLDQPSSHELTYYSRHPSHDLPRQSLTDWRRRSPTGWQFQVANGLTWNGWHGRAARQSWVWFQMICTDWQGFQAKGARHKIKIMQVPVVYTSRVLYNALHSERHTRVRVNEVQSQPKQQQSIVNLRKWIDWTASMIRMKIFLFSFVRILMDWIGIQHRFLYTVVVTFATQTPQWAMWSIQVKYLATSSISRNWIELYMICFDSQR